MSAHSPQTQTARRNPLRSFWILVGVATLAAGSLTGSLAASPSPTTGLRVAVSGLIALVSLTLAIRIMVALSRARRP